MKIAIDWDDTFTTDPQLWAYIASLAQKSGHEVFIVTMRGINQIRDIEMTLEELALILEKPIRIIPTGMNQKRQHCEFLNIAIDVWIDDSPATIDPMFYRNAFVENERTYIVAKNWLYAKGYQPKFTVPKDEGNDSTSFTFLCSILTLWAKEFSPEYFRG